MLRFAFCFKLIKTNILSELARIADSSQWLGYPCWGWSFEARGWTTEQLNHFVLTSQTFRHSSRTKYLLTRDLIITAVRRQLKLASW